MMYRITLTRRNVRVELLLRAPSRKEVVRIITTAAQNFDAQDGHQTCILGIEEVSELEFQP